MLSSAEKLLDDRMALIRELLHDCECKARTQGWEGVWEQQPADMEYIAEQLRERGFALPSASGNNAFTLGELEAIGVSKAYWSRWQLDPVELGRRYARRKER